MLGTAVVVRRRFRIPPRDPFAACSHVAGVCVRFFFFYLVSIFPAGSRRNAKKPSISCRLTGTTYPQPTPILRSHALLQNAIAVALIDDSRGLTVRGRARDANSLLKTTTAYPVPVRWVCTFWINSVITVEKKKNEKTVVRSRFWVGHYFGFTVHCFSIMSCVQFECDSKPYRLAKNDFERAQLVEYSKRIAWQSTVNQLIFFADFQCANIDERT